MSHSKSPAPSASQFPPAWQWWVDEAIPEWVKKHYSPRETWKSKPFSNEDAHFFFRAGDSSDKGTMWVYRYKRAAAKPKPAAAKRPAARPKPAAAKKLAPAAPPPAPARKAPRRARTPQQICTGWFSAARNYTRAGMKSDARRCLNNIVKAYPDSEWARQARAELSKL